MEHRAEAPNASPEVGRLAYRVKDAATAVGLSASRIWQLIDSGDLEARKIGGATVIPTHSLQALIDKAPARQPAGQVA